LQTKFMYSERGRSRLLRNAGNHLEDKGKSKPITGLDRARWFQYVEAPRFQQSAHKSSTVDSPKRPPLPTWKYSWYSYLLETESTPGPRVAGRIMSMKNSDTIGNRTRDLPSCSAVPQPTVPPRAPSRLEDYSASHSIRLSLCLTI
jgi:hypothetical protein